ncbi:MAG: TetR/AcrR family transcriptional regulator [Lachnospiraceae bacterium]|nr:TetR/AcrR family transcriptional regulator [Lachnospiraceae bacterium]
MGAAETREKILKITTDLILERGGDLNAVTIRKIAARAKIGVGLVNHYFESKEQLVCQCIDSVFRELFEMLTGTADGESILASGDEITRDEATTNAAKAVMSFLISHEAIARAALLRDAENPSGQDYTSKLVDAFAYAMADHKKIEEVRSNPRMNERMKNQFIEHFVNEQRIKSFMIISSVKEAFIRRESVKETLSADLTDEEARDEFMESLMEQLL